jgi:4-amino-4-deoxy-L-arabinose transferase-like glycosyltransferase
LFLLLVLAFFSFFFRLGSAPMQRWDESRLALNAANMLKYQQWLVTMYKGRPDLWNTKPPLMIWLQALSIQALGYTELAIRLPAALAALTTTLLVFWYGQRYLRGHLMGWLAAVVLVSTPGYVGWHVARTGDYEALLVLWTTAGMLAFGRYLATESRRALWLAAGAFTLAIFTKGVAGVLGLPALVLAAAFTGQLPRLLRRCDLYLCGLAVIVAVGSYYGAREITESGYLAAVWANELGGRAGGALEGHQESAGWYIRLLAESKFSFWLAFASIGIALGLRYARATTEYQTAVLCGSWVGWYLLLLSSMQTKLTWYDAPIYPALALLAALGIGALTKAVSTHFQLPTIRPVVWLFVSLLLFWGPYASLMNHLTTLYRQRFTDPALQLGRHLQRQYEVLPALKAYSLLMPPTYNGNVEWYGFVAEQTRHHRLIYRPVSAISRLAVSETIVICGSQSRKRLLQRHVVEVLWQQDSCATVRIIR